MEDGIFPKRHFIGVLLQGNRPARKRKIRSNDVVNCNLNTVGINIEDSENFAGNRSGWRLLIWER